MEEVVKDPRFSHIVKDARFRRLPKKHVKVKVDKRFQSMFTDKKFQIKCKVDKRGRPINVGGSEDLKRFYDISDSDESEDDLEKECDSSNEAGDEVEEEESIEEKSGSEVKNDGELVVSKEKDVNTENNEILETDKNVDKKNIKNEDNTVKKSKRSDKKLLTAEIKRKLRNSKIDYARGEGKFLSESSSEEEVSESEVSDIEVHEWGELDNDAETTEEATNRLAICNMNWDRIKAVDLMVLFHSFLPPGGLIHSITIYPSDFGIERMKEEEEQGPKELKELKADQEDEEMDREKMEKLRKYQLNRLKYYYAIMVCDSKETANTLYKECDGLEYECSAVKLDLRFVPDDTTFDQEAKDVCTELPDLSTYKPKLFRTTALTCSKVELTWDENDHDRDEIIRSAHSGNINEDQLKEYLAYSSTDDDDSEDARILINDNELKTETEQSSIDKYKTLLADIELNEKKKKNNEVNLEVTWNLKLENKANEMVKEKMKDLENLTPFEQFMEKKKEKKKKKKKEKRAQIEQMENSDDNAFSDDDIPSDIDMQDPYFKEELDQMKRKKKKVKKIEEIPETEEDKQKKAELELLMLDNDSKDKHFSLKKIEEMENKKKKKGKKRKMELEPKPADDFKIDVNDERFSALYTSHHFNIDPTDPQYRPTKATQELIQEKLKRRAAGEVKQTPLKMPTAGKLAKRLGINPNSTRSNAERTSCREKRKNQR